MTYKFHALALSAVAAFATFAAEAEARNLNIAITPPEESHYGAAANAFKEKIEELSNGEITAEVKAGGVLGGEREVLEGMQIGSIEMAVTSTGPIGGFVPSTYVLDLPFLFKDYASARAVLDGPIGQGLLDDFEPVGLVALGWGENGFRYITNSRKPIQTPEDLQGLKIRTMENDIHLGAFSAMDAAPLPMSFNEVITALQQGTIDGQENPMSILISNRIWEAQKYATLTGHFYSPAVIVMSKIHWDQLTEEEQGWVREATAAAVAANRAYVDNDEKRGLAMLRENGMEVIDTIDQAAFAEAVSGVYDTFADTYGSETLDQIRAAQE